MRKLYFASLDRLFEYVTKLILSVILLDAAYLLVLVRKMTENTSLAMERYHTVPLMAEHILAAVVLYLICMILLCRESEK